MIEVAIVIGSESDRDTIDGSGLFKIMEECGIGYDFSIISSDRNPGVLVDYCGKCMQEGARVFIAGAGMAARLPGTIAAHTKYIPVVIGVAIASEEFPNAMDAMLSIVRSPSGCPSLFAGIGRAGFKNAALAAIQILATGESERSREIREKLITYRQNNMKKPILGEKRKEV